MNLHDRWELDPAREDKPVRIGITVPLDRRWWQKLMGKIKEKIKCNTHSQS